MFDFFLDLGFFEGINEYFFSVGYSVILIFLFDIGGKKVSDIRKGINVEGKYI